MRIGIRTIVAASLVTAALPLAGVASSSNASCPTVKPKALDFGKPTFIDKTRAGGEPVSVTAQDGSIIVSAHAGTTHIYKDPTAAPGAGDFAVGYSNQTLNWRSADGGKTWKYVGVAGTEFGPHSPTSTGFSDPDLTMDAGGKLYNVEIDLANVAVFASPDDGQSWPTANPLVSAGDRPWVVGQEKDEVFLIIAGPKQLWRSTDGGITWALVGQGAAAVAPSGKILVDTLNPKKGLVGPLTGGGVGISEFEGQDWKSYPTHVGNNVGFDIVGIDRAGWIYTAIAGGYQGATDVTADGRVAYSYFNRQTKKWSEVIDLPIPKGDALWPWVIAGDDGRLAIVWYQTLAGKPDDFYIYAAYTTNAHGSRVRCSDGSTRFVGPQFDIVNASGRPIHIGDICQAGVGCNGDTNFAEGDRRLGDFFTVNFDHLGNLYIVSGDSTLKNVLGGPKPVANPIFIKQTSGDRMLVKPDKIRKSRCVFPQTSC